MSSHVFHILALAALAACATPPAREDAVRASNADRTPRTSIEIRACVVDLPTPAVRELLSDGERSGAARDKGFLDRLRARDDVLVLSSPRLVLEEGGRGDIAVTSSEEHVADWTVGDAGVPRAITKSFDEGLWLEATPRTRADGSVELAYALRRSSIRRPIRETTVAIPGSGERRAIALPEIDTVASRAKPVLRAGECWVVAFDVQAVPLPERTALAVLTSKIVDPPRGAAIESAAHSAVARR